MRALGPSQAEAEVLLELAQAARSSHQGTGPSGAVKPPTGTNPANTYAHGTKPRQQARGAEVRRGQQEVQSGP